MTQELFSVWEGVFSSFSEAGGDSDAFDSDIWINKQKERINCALKDLETNNFSSKDYPLPLVVAMLLETQAKLSVLDFGGGMGLQYLEVIAKVPNAKENMNYYIVDGKTSIDCRPRVLNQFHMLRFLYDIESISEPIDVIHIGSTLHYIEDWRSLLQALNNKFKPDYIVFSDLLAGNISSFVSHQNFYEKKIPVHMFSEKEILNFIEDLGLRLIYKTSYISNILGNEDLPNSKLPDGYRIKKTLNMILMNANARK